MATDFHKIFGCPVCGYRLSEGDPNCPRCNNKLESGMKLECPFCGELVDPSVRECPVCHVDYSEFKEKTIARGSDSSIDELLNEIIKMESMQIKEEKKKYSCPACAWLLDGSERACPKCGRDLTDEYAFQCPICGSPVSAEASSCPVCGAALEGKSEQTHAADSQPRIDELEELARTVRARDSAKKPERVEPEAAPFTQQAPPQPEEPAETVRPEAEAVVPEVAEPEKPVEAPPEQPTETPVAKPAAPKGKKRKLKTKPSA